MNIHNRSTLIAFYTKRPDCKGSLEKWYHDVETCLWEKPSDVVRDFNTARTLKNNRAIFEINRYDYRLIVEITTQRAGYLLNLLEHTLNMIKLIPKKLKDRNQKRRSK